MRSCDGRAWHDEGVCDRRQTLRSRRVDSRRRTSPTTMRRTAAAPGDLHVRWRRCRDTQRSLSRTRRSHPLRRRRRVVRNAIGDRIGREACESQVTAPPSTVHSLHRECDRLEGREFRRRTTRGPRSPRRTGYLPTQPKEQSGSCSHVARLGRPTNQRSSR